jgi:hypothetical protein
MVDLDVVEWMCCLQEWRGLPAATDFASMGCASAVGDRESERCLKTCERVCTKDLVDQCSLARRNDSAIATSEMVNEVIRRPW